jgi:tRNA A37 methylthiotransferase MiaB
MEPKVRPETIHERSLRLRELGEHKNALFRRKLVGTDQRALILKERTSEGLLVGLTGNYQEVLVGGDETLATSVVWVRMGRSLPDGRWEAEFVREEPLARSGVSAR